MPKKAMTDGQLLKELRDRLEWDGQGYWLPEICIKELERGDDECPEPSMSEFRAALREHFASL